MTGVQTCALPICCEKRIPFEISVDPFYSESNIQYLERKVAEYKAGRLKLSEHELIED